jgi:hypothetical protein
MKIIATSKTKPKIDIVVSKLEEFKFTGVVFKSNRPGVKVGYTTTWNRSMFDLFYETKTNKVLISRQANSIEVKKEEEKIIEMTQKIESFKMKGSDCSPKSILLEANGIVNGDRNEQYGDPLQAFKEYSNILEANFGIKLTPAEICKVQIAIKLGRLKYKHKRDSVVDLCGYAEILNRLEDGGL